ncbi:dihydroorotate dehydrogenase [Cupriavidus necator]|uniref:Dihydroorotate dehydrogenase n=1 Tax=Cupriavidus necator TaxID=106590 RepID=A0A367PBE8_CUPNE|nr:dihydroorotate dehydrogenase [Cupriavidus necator]QQX86039.1 dihydroorotate dehydrogenase [Cupriavidus necator]RCJ04547.1 dihydroorotate dehydrogenase [Cupriavidus necator]
MVDLSVEIGGLKLANPIMPASGTFAEGMADVFDLNRLGAIVTKTITDDLREGNPPPRVAEFRDATLFSIGIPSKGGDYYLRETLPFYRAYKPPLIASISANTVEEFGTLARKLSVPGVAAIEANVSCPNLKKDGKAFGMDPDATFQVVRAMKSASPLPIWPKMTPNAGNVVEVALAAQAAGADAIVVSNAILAMAIDIETHRPRIANLMGGLTGPATKPIMLRIAYQCAQAVTIPVIGCGGISSAADALEFILAGATAVQVGTANFLSPNAMPKVIDDLVAYCERRGVSRLRGLIGGVQLYDAPMLSP